MSLLLDTHVILWWLTDDDALTPELKTRLDDDPDAWCSAVSVWEVAIKQATGKLLEPADVARRVRDSGFRALPVTADHAVEAGALPLIHRDPFDRMLVAQARCEGLTLVSHDADIARYDVPVLAT